MARILVASALSALAYTAVSIPLPDRLSNLESREEFRQRTKEVFEAKKYHHKKFEEKTGAGFDSERLTTKASMYYDISSGKFTLKKGASNKYDGSLAKAAFMDTVCVEKHFLQVHLANYYLYRRFLIICLRLVSRFLYMRL